MGNSHGLHCNEEDQKINTPDTKILPKLKDPRSPTEGIIRTPIEVMRTPKTASNTYVMASSVDSPSMLNGMMEIETEMKRASELKVKTEFGVGGLYEKPYLETDLDAIGDGVIVTKAIMQHRRVEQLLQMKGQPVNTNEEKSQNACIDSLSFLIDRVTFDDTSLFEVDTTDRCFKNQALVDQVELEDWNTVKEGKRSISYESLKEVKRSISFESLDESILKIKESDYGATRRSIKGKPFLTPSGKKLKHTSHTPRRPLSCLSKNVTVEPTKSGVKRKVWRGIQEERLRRGVRLADENTPPLLPPNDKVSSAPGKLMRRRIVDWDQDATMFI